jgi:hypothetical protein
MVTVKGAIMKRSIVAVAALLLLLSSATYANPPRAQRRARHVPFWFSVLCWLGHDHQYDHGRYAPRHEYGYLPPGHRGRPERDWGWHRGWDNGRHNGWDRKDGDRGDRHGSGRPNEHEHENGRGGGHGRG